MNFAASSTLNAAACQLARQEAQTWKCLKHPHILEFKGILETGTDLCLVSAYAENGPLAAYLKAYPGVDRLHLVMHFLRVCRGYLIREIQLHQIASGLAFLHKEQIVHGDVKAANVVVSAAGNALVCDFGLSRASDTTTATLLRGMGSLRWLSPELLDQAKKSFASDVWAFGMVIYEVRTLALSVSI